ncbi:hypothetical protein LX32DRAFT_687056 [Colletotrichum zoysiae]|uniref:Uncharacterized protein n=1 Tax=Colletotrichum zoysiae TaxID=1216348 RepID=A0AAD9LVZ2_9PEZI|nr:hypothetical protein LX32DRAFT_687056 [Colletotrichum zoysiae]
MASYFDSVASSTDYNRRAKRHPPSLDSLNQSTSYWSKDQLLACRVLVVKKELRQLPITLEPSHTNELIEQVKRSCRLPTDPDARRLSSLCRGPDSDELSRSSGNTHSWRWNYDAQGIVWSALSLLKIPGASTAHAPSPIRDAEHEDGHHAGPSTPRAPRTTAPPETDGDHASPSTPPTPRTTAPPETPQSSQTLPPLRSTDSPDLPRRSKSGRQSRPPVRHGFVSIQDPIDGSSPNASSSGLFSSSPHSAWMPDQGPSTTLHLLPEPLTVHFISAFIQEALLWLPGQNRANANPVVVFDNTSAAHEVALHGNVKFTSRDDGGLKILYNGRPLGRVALLEAKRSIKNSPIEGQLPFPDEWFGQIVGEALAAKLTAGAWHGHRNSILVIAAARHYIRFLQIDVSDLYKEQLNDRAQEESAEFSEFIKVYATKWFDLANADDRRVTVENLTLMASLSRTVVLGPRV